MYKQALDILGVNVSDINDPKDWSKFFSSDKALKQGFYDKAPPDITVKQFMSDLIKSKRQYAPDTPGTYTMNDLLQQVRNRIQKTPDRTTKYKIGQTIKGQYYQDVPGTAYYSGLFDWLNKKGIREPALAYSKKKIHPALIAHQLGHSAQPNKALTFFVRNMRGDRNLLAALAPWLIRNYRANNQKDFDPSKVDKKDLAIVGGISAANALDSILTRQAGVRNQFDASRRALRYLHKAKISDLGQTGDARIIGNAKIFDKNIYRESKNLLREALKTYKTKNRIKGPLLSALIPMATLGLSVWQGKKNKEPEVTYPNK